MLLGAQMFGAKVRDIKASSNGGVTVATEYEVSQSEKGDKFYVKSTSLNELIELVALGHASVGNRFLWAGRWQGTYQCQKGPDVAALDPVIAAAHDSYKVEIDQILEEGSSLLVESTAIGGGFEKLRIEIGKQATASVEGANSAQDRWSGDLRGKTANDQMTLEGPVRDVAGRTLAQCSVALKLTPITQEEIAALLNKKS